MPNVRIPTFLAHPRVCTDARTRARGAAGPRSVVVAALFLGAVAWGCDDEPEAPASIDAAARARMLYESYCGDCHGAGGQGDGPLATSLDPRPPDLTRIRVRNGDLFINDAVAAYIDGRKVVEAHGSREMPVWGRSLDDRNERLDQELRLTPDMIDSIVEHVRTLQRDAPEAPRSTDAPSSE